MDNIYYLWVEMVLNYIWIAFFLIAFLVAILRTLIWYFSVHHHYISFGGAGLYQHIVTRFGDSGIFKTIVDSTFSSSEDAFKISIGLTGIMALWLGLMNIGEKAGLIRLFTRIVNPLFIRLFPELPKEHPAIGQIVMNFTANMLGMGNAATPLGLKAMQSMQELNPDKEKASNPQIMFLVLNTAGFTLLPVTIMMFRAERGATDPSDIFIPILLASFFATITGVALVAFKQRIKILDPILLAWLAGIGLILTSLIFYFHSLTSSRLALVSGVVSNFILFGIIIAFITAGLIKKINVFDSFIEGAKNGFSTAVKIIPYLVAMLVGIAVFRSSGAMDLLMGTIKYSIQLSGLNTDFVDALPTAFMKPLSGSGARGLMLDSMKTYGADSFAGRLSCIFQGSADTTLYIVALYFGSVGITKTRYAVTYGLLTDLFGIIAAIFIAYLFFK